LRYADDSAENQSRIVGRKNLPSGVVARNHNLAVAAAENRVAAAGSLVAVAEGGNEDKLSKKLFEAKLPSS
jgi:hypothetical protein